MNEPTCQHPNACWYKHTSGDTKCMWCDDQERWAAKLGETVIARDRYRAWLVAFLANLESFEPIIGGSSSVARSMCVKAGIPFAELEVARGQPWPKC